MTTKDIALKVNPDLVCKQDFITGWFQIVRPNGTPLTDWHMFEPCAWKEITEIYGTDDEFYNRYFSID